MATIRAAALAKANAVRKALGLPRVDHLYKGIPCNANNCPITNTIYDDDITRDDYMIYSRYNFITVTDQKTLHRHDFPTSQGAARFMRRFDDGEIPDLMAPEVD